MNAKLQRNLLAAWQQLPVELRGAPATETELAAFEADFGPIPEDYRWFLLTLGGGPVGAEYVDDITALRASHVKFAREAADPRGWTMRDVFIVGWDGGGNPFGIARGSGELLVEDHDFGGVHTMAPSFAQFLADGILR